MSYQSLARKYRPKRFEELVGQKAIVKALCNSLRLNRESHCIVFSGVRGVGKTTLARLYAKALNCEDVLESRPCGVCESCIAVAEGNHEDVMEIDGASNTGVDDIRDLQETLGYVPQRSRYKIYIIDEVHMLSTSAFNALLKTLEEPPPHVFFMFATTELGKLPATILGRCSVYHLNLLSTEEIIGRVSEILKKEGIKSDEEAIYLVAKEGQGSMRDALTFLDQAIALGSGELKIEWIQKIIPSASFKSGIDFIKSLIRKDTVMVLEIIDKWDQAGVDFTNVVEELIRSIRNAYIFSRVSEKTSVSKFIHLSKEEFFDIEEVSSGISGNALSHLFRDMMRCRSELNRSRLDRFVLENYSIEWCFNKLSFEDDKLSHNLHEKHFVDEVVDRCSSALPLKEKENEIINVLKKMESDSSKVLENSPANSRQDSSSTDKKPQIESQEKVSNIVSSSYNSGFPESWRMLVDLWKQQKPLQARIIEEVHLVEYNEKSIVIAVNKDSLAGSKLLQREVQNKIKEQFARMFSFYGEFKVKLLSEIQKADSINGLSGSNGIEKSLLEVSKMEKKELSIRTIEELKQHPITKGALSVFGGDIQEIRLNE
ncbi:MAG: DNA polymerase III subunit gamma/tau [Oligoflexales bacterium]|nr:DNA polymerase III subunit gamma/tau [Oligoflexales bacterium]